MKVTVKNIENKLRARKVFDVLKLFEMVKEFDSVGLEQQLLINAIIIRDSLKSEKQEYNILKRLFVPIPSVKQIIKAFTLQELNHLVKKVYALEGYEIETNNKNKEEQIKEKKK